MDLARAHWVVDTLVSGNVWVNSLNILPLDLPFGGAKQPGFIRKNSRDTLDAQSGVK